MDLQAVVKQIQPFVLCISFVGLYIVEYLYPQRKDIIDRKHDLTNLLIGLLNMVFVAMVGYYFQQFIVWCNTHGIGLMNYLSLSSSITLTVELLLIDIFMYWWHRANHTIPLLWKFHSYHHLDTKMNTTSGLRFHTGELTMSYLVRMAIYPLLGLSLNSVLLHGLILFPALIFHHSNIRISATTDSLVRWFIVSPYMHRTHHSVVESERNSNYSSLIPYWDSIFGTNNKTINENTKFGV